MILSVSDNEEAMLMYLCVVSLNLQLHLEMV